MGSEVFDHCRSWSLRDKAVKAVKLVAFPGPDERLESRQLLGRMSVGAIEQFAKRRYSFGRITFPVSSSASMGPFLR